MCGKADRIPHVINSFVFGDSKRIKHNGVKKAGALGLMSGVTYGIVQVNG
jgi:hypothetical protein